MHAAYSDRLAINPFATNGRDWGNHHYTSKGHHTHRYNLGLNIRHTTIYQMLISQQVIFKDCGTLFQPCKRRFSRTSCIPVPRAVNKENISLT